ncbi:hypothetical protein [Pseudomonas purpurea]|uniref:hypothetical protein n=1 Tax=Pseudomonas purpurea TaxID=3136737 RepID=UPI00326740BA
MLQTHAIVKKFVDVIARRDSDALQGDFKIASVVAEEIYEDIEGYFGESKGISIAGLEQAFELRGQRPFIDVYETHDKTLGLECVLFDNGVPGEAILHVEVKQFDGQFELSYKYIGS